MIKLDPISLVVYAIIIIIIYFVVGIVLKMIELFLLLPVFNDFNNLVIMHVALFPLRLLHSILYATTVVVNMAILLTIIIFVLLVLYLLRFIFLKIVPIIILPFPPFVLPFGIVIYNTVPPFKQLEDAGIFKLMDDIGDAIINLFPSIGKFFLKFIEINITFSKDKFLDLVKTINPSLELDRKQFDKVFIERFVDKNKDKSVAEIYKSSHGQIKDILEFFDEKQKEDAKEKSKFYIETKKALEQAVAADSYKSYKSSLPNMTYIDKMTTSFNNKSDSFSKTLFSITDIMTLELSRTIDK